MPSLRVLRALVLAAAATAVAMAPHPALADVQLKAMTFNVRTSYASTDQGSTCADWDGVRKSNLVSNIKSVDADFVGTQETSDEQKTYLDTELASLYTGIGTTTGSLNGNADEIDVLYYRTDTWTLLTNGQFWLGTDPDSMTAGWDMTYYRTCVWGRFQHITTGQTVCVMNTHYETPGNDEAQENGSNIIIERMATVCDASDSLIVLMGDFNALRTYPAMTLLFDANLKEESTDPTYCGDMISATCTQKFDFTFYRLLNEDVCHISTDVSRVAYDGCYPSDHAGLVASFCLDGSCCGANSTSSSGSVSLDDSGSATVSSVSGEEDIVGTVKSATSDTVSTDASSASGSGSSQQITTKSEEGSSASTTVGIIFGVLGAVAVVALVVVRRKKILEKRAMDDKDPSLRPVPGYFTRADSDVQALSPLRAGSEASDISESPIPELAAAKKDARDSRSSSVSVTESEKAMLEARRSSGIASHVSSRRSSSAVIMGPSDFSESRYSQSSFGSMSMAESQIHFSEVFAPESCTSDDGGPLSKTKTDFAML